MGYKHDLMIGRSKKFFTLVGGLLAIGTLIFAGYLYWLIRSSNPPLGRGASVSGLSHEVRIEQDALGVPTIRGETTQDIYRGQGWVTARDRLFQMDLIRRKLSGRLSEIFGEKLVGVDTFHRKLGLSHVVRKATSAMGKKRRSSFQAYAEGVNAFLREGALPFEIRVLGYQPEPWRVEDSLLVILAMFADLDFQGQYLAERAVTLLYEKRPKPLADFLTSLSGFLDSPVLPEPPLKPLDIPRAETFDLRKELPSAEASPAFDPTPAGSNAWALSGKFTQSGAPIVAGDPHLDLFTPNIWYRVRLAGGPLHVTGVSLPGVPGIVIGSNADVAWSITHPSGDTVDLVRVSQTAKRQQRLEEIRIKKRESHRLVVEDTEWGPILRRDGRDDYAVQWVALDDNQLSQMDTTEFLLARNTSEFLGALSRWKGPVSNVVFATREGDIGWTLAGNLPDRRGFDGRTIAPRDASHYWKGYIPFERLPRVINPPSGYIVSANQRMSSNESDVRRTANNLVCPDRAFRIRQLLDGSKGGWSVDDSSRVQLDVFSPTGAFYRDILTAVLTRSKNTDPWIKAIGALVQNWDGVVSVDSPVFSFIRVFRLRILETLVDPLWGVGSLDESWIGEERLASSQWNYPEPIVKALLDRSPAHLLSRRYASYDEAVIDAALVAAKKLVKNPEELQSLRWGKTNRTAIPHPFSLVLPAFLGRFFNMPNEEVGGTLSTPKAAALLHGRFHSASMRVVVDLSDSRRSVFSQPGGQSGNFQSPNYSDQFAAWLKGTPNPFEPGKVVTVDLLRP